MPIYEYECRECGNKFDQYFPLKEFDAPTKCPDCSGEGKKILTCGGVQGDHPTWLDDPVLQENLKGEDGPPILSRQKFKNYLKDNRIEQAQPDML